ncbi:uncharacterized protein BDCG_16550 [Blastomyces dermatitidis ER-3]|uniref:Uncharacterized protein n=1 Tax=Ajellomyces dermatitidis (strain ER-3 / ATCC MYA-2586) TaxID=559297 RepID=A0ABX2VST0_AJEDR|nr:uncharacterized protein BDCG_16550 [Blastomyces dermatitidis ER-3]OAT00261.1 hypothetical protein BDCG_16550 [Blastomyces dermatitidis ER-3]
MPSPGERSFWSCGDLPGDLVETSEGGSSPKSGCKSYEQTGNNHGCNLEC